MHRPVAHRQRGVTLVELMVATAVSAIVLVAVMGIAASQHRTYAEGRRVRDRQSNARFGLDYLEHAVRQAGFGMDPQFAFDFDFYKCAGATSYASANCTAATRDAIDGPDEIVMYTRDPNYQVGDPAAGLSAAGNAWVVKEAAADSVKLAMRPGDYIGKGQILQLICPGAMTYTYVTASATTKLGASAAAADATVSLAAASPDSPFLQNGVITSPASANCFNAGQAMAYRIQRQHYFILSDQAFAGAETGLPRTYLVLDTGTDRNDDGNIDEKDLIPVAADVVDLQFAYILNNPFTATPAASRANIFGDGDAVEEMTALVANAPLSTQLPGVARACDNVTPGTQTAQAFGRFSSPCLFDKGDDDLYRKLDYPGNIRAVRISMVARTQIPDAEGGITRFLPPGDGLLLENRASFDLTGALPAGYDALKLFGSNAQLRTRYKYMVLQTTAQAGNLNSNGLFMF